MKLSIEQIKRAIVEGRIGAITLDTCIFDRNSRRLEDGLLPRLEQFRDGRVRVVLCDVVCRELFAHLLRDASEAETSLKAAHERLERTWNISSDDTKAVYAKLVGTDTAKDVAQRRVQRFMNLVRAHTIVAQDHPVMAELVSRYFSAAAPFEATGAKRNEFPDAIALLTLEAWARTHGATVLVVSTDEGWLRFCEASDVLVAVNDLASALSWFQDQAAEHEVRRLAREIGKSDPLRIVPAVREAIETHIDNIAFDVHASSDLSFEENIDDVRVTDLDQSALRDEDAYVLVESDDEQLIVSATVPVTFQVACSFSFDKWDSTDKEFISFGDGSATTETTVDVTIMLFFSKADDQVVLECIEVNKESATVEFGEVEPDWMNDGYDEP